MSKPYDYTVEIDAPSSYAPCECGDCGWKGPFSKLVKIEDCSLTPGDPAPAGRCPQCDTLAYVMKKPHCILTGDPLGGFSVIGPFDYVENAQAYVERHRFERAWWIVPMDNDDIWKRHPERDAKSALQALAEKLIAALEGMLEIDDWHDDAIADPQMIANAQAVLTEARTVLGA